MSTKIICCSFEPGSMGGFITVCNGVNHNRPQHFSKTIAVTKEAFIAACKDRHLFNGILGINIAEGWQNALRDAIVPFLTMKETFDPDTAAKVSSELDVQLRGEDAVNADIAAVEKENAEIEKAAKKITKAKASKAAKDVEPAPASEPVKETETPEVLAEMDKVAEQVVAAEQGQPVPQPEEPVTQEPEEPKVENDEPRPTETTDNSGSDARGESDSELPVDGPRAESAE